jgi:PIN domain nuclease of toxin-antitoxin system
VRLLLDTHIMLRLAEDEINELPQWVGLATEDAKHTQFVSVVSIWEVSLKHRLGKLPLPCPLPEWPELLLTLGVTILDLEVAPIVAELDPVPNTKDPFDRLLLTIAQANGMRLLTLDRALLRHPLAWRPA